MTKEQGDRILIEAMRKLRSDMCEVAENMVDTGDLEIIEHGKELFGAAAMMGTWILGMGGTTVPEQGEGEK